MGGGVKMQGPSVAVAILMVGALVPSGVAGQGLANADSIAVYGVLLIAGIDKFEYLSDEPLTIILDAVNTSGSAVTIPGSGDFCPLKFVDEIWCQPDSSGCIEYSDNWCVHDRVTTIQPGVTRLMSYREVQSRPGSGNWIHTQGRVRFWNPWNSPWQEGLNFELSVSFHRSDLVPVLPIRWGAVKQLYRL